MKERVVFTRVGWMEWYMGPQPGDERPIGGGRYNKNHIGSELFNFRRFDGRLLGYIESRGGRLNLSRIDPSARGQSLSGVTVVFVSTSPAKLGRGQVVIGWHRNATVYESSRPRPVPADQYAYSCDADPAEYCLLPIRFRSLPVPANTKGAFGQSNIRYPFNEAGSPDLQRWMHTALQLVREYAGPNLLDGAPTVVEDKAQEIYQEAEFRSSGQGFRGTAAERRAVEDLAMKRAIEHFRKLGYSVDHKVHKTKPYDLYCSKRRRPPLFVEIKGTVGDGQSVILTKNEVQHMQRERERCALFVLAGVKLKRRGRRPIATGGTPRVLCPLPDLDGRLSPICYNFSLATADELNLGVGVGIAQVSAACGAAGVRPHPHSGQARCGRLRRS